MKIVLALGGNALQSNPKDKTAKSQLETCKETAGAIVDLVEAGHDIAIVHGNGPQVGQIVATVEDAIKQNKTNVLFPFDVCGSFTQGYIGYHLQSAIKEELNKRNINKNIATVITQVVVAENDPGFQNPTKPIGSFYSKEEAEMLVKTEGFIMKEDAGRGYRRVVPSPKPIDIVEKDIIREMFSLGNIVISCGGGGIPVVKNGLELKGVEAVIDKDFAAEKLAEILNADCLLILTAVDRVCINYNKPDAKELITMSLNEVDKYISQGQFAPGSMLPKVEACKKFVSFDNSKTSIIASLFKSNDALEGLSGTKILK